MNKLKNTFFAQNKSSVVSTVDFSKGPTPAQIHDAKVNDQFWLILEQFHLNTVAKTGKLNKTANAIKDALQTFGPCLTGSEIELRQNKGAAKNRVYHAHASDEHATYVLEWTEINASYYYNPCVKKDNSIIEKQCIYLEVINEQLQYTVINPAGVTVTNCIEKEALISSGINLHKVLSDGNLIKKHILPHWPKLLDVMAKRGDTCINRMIALLNFDKHENFKFTQQPLDDEKHKHILAKADNITAINVVSVKVSQIKDKFKGKQQNQTLSRR